MALSFGSAMLASPITSPDQPQIQNHNTWSTYQEKSVQLADGMVRWIDDADTAYVIDIQAGPKTRGRALLQWLKDTTGKQLQAVGVVEDARGFWDRMEEDELVAGQTDENFMDFFALRARSQRQRSG